MVVVRLLSATTTENFLSTDNLRVIFFLSPCMIDQFPEHYYIAKSYGLVQEFVETYRYFRKQGVSRPFAAYYAAKEWDL